MYLNKINNKIIRTNGASLLLSAKILIIGSLVDYGDVFI